MTLRRSRQDRALGFLVLGALALGATVAPAAASLRISSSSAQANSDIGFIPTLPQVSSGVPHAVYLQDTVIDGALDLWSVPLAGGTPVRLSDDLSSGQAPTFAISSDGTRVVYTVAQETVGQEELYSIPIAGPANTWTRLSPSNLSAGRSVSLFLVSPTSDRVFYIMDYVVNSQYELYTVPIAGGSSLPLNAPLSFDYDVDAFRASPDGERVIFRAGRTASNNWALYTALANGSGSEEKISISSSSGHVSSYFQISPDSTRVVYLEDATVFQRNDLYSVPANDGASTQLNVGVAAGTTVDPNFLISPELDSPDPRVVFRATTTGTSGAVYNLYSARITGGAVVRLNGALDTSEDVETDFRISADGGQVVYRSDEEEDGTLELYSVPIAGGTPTKLNGILASNRDVQEFKISPDSLRVVYRADELVNDRDDLFSVSIDGSPARIQLNSPQMISSGDVQKFRISPDSNLVVFGADAIVDGKDELFAVPIAGGAIATMSELSSSTRDVVLIGSQGTPAFVISSDSQGVLYAADQNTDEKIELYASSLAGPPNPPTGVVATAGNALGEATVTFGDGGGSVTYTVTWTPNSGIGEDISNASSLSHDITGLPTGLPNGTAYTFHVTATNGQGTSDPADSNVVVLPAAPGQRLAPTATERNRSADVQITAQSPQNDGGSAITGYTVTAHSTGGAPGNDLNAGSLEPVHYVEGLTNDNPYTFTVVAHNAVGTSVPSPESDPVTPSCPSEVGVIPFCDGLESSDTSQWDLTVSPVPPGPPTDAVATGGDAEAQVTFVAPLDDGGSAITGYTVISDPPGGVDSDDGSGKLTHLVTGLTNGTPYTFTVTATNGAGTGNPSLPSNEVTPNPPS